MSAVPRDLRDGAYALGSNRMQVALRVVVPAAISGIIASFVLAISRAVGETMIVLIAAGGQPNWTFNPTEAVQTMTAFIAATGQGDVPTGSIEYKTIFAVGRDALRDDARDEPLLDPARAQVPRGLRMSAQPAALRPEQAARARVRARSSTRSCYFSLGDRDRHARRAARPGRRQGLQVRRPRPAARAAVGRPADRRGAAGDPRHDLPRPAADRLHRADRRRHGHLPRGVREPRPLVQPPARGQHPEPRRASRRSSTASSGSPSSSAGSASAACCSPAR